MWSALTLNITEPLRIIRCEVAMSTCLPSSYVMTFSNATIFMLWIGLQWNPIMHVIMYFIINFGHIHF